MESRSVKRKRLRLEFLSVHGYKKRLQPKVKAMDSEICIHIPDTRQLSLEIIGTTKVQRNSLGVSDVVSVPLQCSIT
ncbi:hypothetical protein VNO78_28765 [Psophocarpus tetragonolobus]|uniref:Uncharacterized protein n=1 Tax=Psophocarpus tetragonolobus TaxID=3891 RepID=A0AAN9RU92_PSOTE